MTEATIFIGGLLVAIWFEIKQARADHAKATADLLEAIEELK